MESQGTRTLNSMAAQALGVARRFLGRFNDAFTRSRADDLAQDAAFEAWSRRATLRRLDRWDAFVRTVSRRRRCRAIEEHLRVRVDSLDADPELHEQLIVDEPEQVCASIAERAVPVEWCLSQMRGVLGRLDPLNECIVRSYYEGFSCGELAERYGMPEERVKVRLHRSRQRIRREFEVRVRRMGVDA